MNLIDKYKGKYFSILGDSISTFEGVSIPKHAVYYDTSHKLYAQITKMEDTWWGRLISELGGQLLINNSISGSTVTYHPSYEYQSYGCSDERTASLSAGNTNPDVILVYLGTNDWGAAVKVSDNGFSQSKDLTIFSVAYSKMLEKLKINYPNAEIWCFTLSTSYCSARSDFSFPYYSGGWHISEYCEVIRNCSQKHGCRLIELYKDCSAYDTIDGFHPNKNGMKTIADMVLFNLI